MAKTFRQAKCVVTFYEAHKEQREGEPGLSRHSERMLTFPISAEEELI